MRLPSSILALSFVAACSAGVAAPSPEATSTGPAIGAAAPGFTLTDTEGTAHTLADLRGQTVVLEWFNPDCPFVVHGHGPGGPLRDLGDTWHARDGVTWLAINSGADGKQGHGTARNQAARREYAMAYPVLLDPGGDVGRAYGAKTTPHLYVIDGEGVLRYAGGLDDAPLGKAPGAAPTPFLANALDELAAGKPVSTPRTKPYGCSVKY